MPNGNLKRTPGRRVGSCVIIAAWLTWLAVAGVGCDEEQTLPQTTPDRATPDMVSARSVVVYYADEGHYTHLGLINCSLSGMGDMLRAPAEPTVYVFRNVPPKHTAANVQAGHAYVHGDGGLQLLGTVDLDMTDSKIGLFFEVLEELPQPQSVSTGRQPEDRPNFVLRVSGEEWQEYGIFEYEGHRLVRSNVIRRATSEALIPQDAHGADLQK